jgi:MYXO-CTERM domain-containing protein
MVSRDKIAPVSNRRGDLEEDQREEIKMKLVSALALAALAGVASANIVATPAPLDSEPGYVGRAVVYSAIAGPYAGFPAATGSLGFDDYSSTMTARVETLQDMRFVGGVSTAGMSIRFDIYSTSAVLVNSFSVTLPQGGNFIWTITGINIDIPKDGIMEAVAPAGSTGRWFLSATAPTVGTQSATFGGANGGALSHRFEFTTPTPGALALLGLGGLAASRRRRA